MNSRQRQYNNNSNHGQRQRVQSNNNNNYNSNNKQVNDTIAISNQIVIMAQPNQVQQRQNFKIVPSLLGQPLIPVDISSKITSYTQMNKEIIEEVKAKHKPQTTINDLYKSSKEKCDLHSMTLSAKCRKCQRILSSLQEQIPDLDTHIPSSINNLIKGNNNTNNDNSTNMPIEEESSFLKSKQSITGNLNSLLLNNILSCQYFKEVLIHKSFQEVIEEIITNVNNIEAWAVGISGVPSTFFCCLYRLVLLSLNEKQISQLTSNANVYVKVIGLLYIRYMSNPSSLWKLLSPFIDDVNEFCPMVDQKSRITIGNYVANLFRDCSHYGTRLPRIPTQIEREIKMMLLMKEENDRRKRINEKMIRDVVKGDRCRIIDNKDLEKESEGNEVIGEFIDFNQKSGKVIVKVNEEEVMVGLGDIEMMGKEENKHGGGYKKENDLDKEESKRSRSRDRSRSKGRRKRSRDRSKDRRRRSRSRSRSRSHRHNDRNKHRSPNYYYNEHYNRKDKEDHYYSKHHNKPNPSAKEQSSYSNQNEVLKKIIEDEKKAALARGRDYAIKPTSFKKSISVKVPGMTKKASRSPSPLKQTIEIIQQQTTKKEPSSIPIDKEPPSKEFLIRQQQLKQQYIDGSLNKIKYPQKGSDYIGPEIMKLG